MEFSSIFLALTAAICWGTGDFCAGWATRRLPVLIVMLVSQLTGLTLLIVMALVRGESGLLPVDLFWGTAASLSGLIGLAALYQAMAVGQMSLAAPVTAVLGAGLPVLFTALTGGLPGNSTLIGFVLALAGIGLISMVQEADVRPAGISLALVSGLTFGVFFICMGQFESDLIFLPVVVVRVVSLLAIGSILLVTRRFVRPTRKLLPVMMLTGVMDSLGNVFFVIAEQSGRLDITSVLGSLYPVMTVVLALTLLRERLTRIQTAGVLLVFIAIPLIAIS